MTLPNQTITVLDPGLGLVQVAANTPVMTGSCSGGTATANTLYTLSSLQFVKSVLGVGELAECAAKELAERGGPVLCVKTSASVAATTSAVTKTGTGTPSPTVAGAATMRTVTVVRVKTGGVLGTAQFDYAHDAYMPLLVNPTWSSVRSIPTGGTYAFPLVGITMTFPAGSYVQGDTFTFTTEPAHTNAADLATAANTILTTPNISFPSWTIAEAFTTATEAFAVATALGAQLQAAGIGFLYARGICDVGSADTKANIIAARAAFSDRRVNPAAGYEIVSSPLAFEGYGNALAPCSRSISARANRVVPSTDLARYAEGSLIGTQYIYWDSNDDPSLDAVGISTLRRWPRVPGFYIGNGYLAGPPGSDYIFWPLGRLMDLACGANYLSMLQFQADDLRTLAGGTLDPKDGAIVNTAGNDGLATALLRPVNARGRQGLVSAAAFTVDLTNNFNQSGVLQTNTAIRPRGYARNINQSLGFSLS